MFWSKPEDLIRLLVIGPLAYCALIVFLRISGKRMLSKMNAFDLVVTIALGSVLATILLSKQVSLAEGLLALLVLLGLQYLAAWSSTRSALVRRLLKSEPRLLFHRGAFIESALEKENVARDAIIAAVRSSGAGDLSEVEAVVLESDGTLSILRGRPGERPTLAGVQRPEDGAR